MELEDEEVLRAARHAVAEASKFLDSDIPRLPPELRAEAAVHITPEVRVASPVAAIPETQTSVKRQSGTGTSRMPKDLPPEEKRQRRLAMNAERVRQARAAETAEERTMRLAANAARARKAREVRRLKNQVKASAFSLALRDSAALREAVTNHMTAPVSPASSQGAASSKSTPTQSKDDDQAVLFDRLQKELPPGATGDTPSHANILLAARDEIQRLEHEEKDLLSNIASLKQPGMS